jgi:hypothetical protein
MTQEEVVEELVERLPHPPAVVADAVAKAAAKMRFSGVTPENLILNGPGMASRHEIAWGVFGPILRRTAEAAE